MPRPRHLPQTIIQWTANIDLLTDAPSLAPRLRWLQENRLQIRQDKLPRTVNGPTDSLPFCCMDYGQVTRAYGESAEDACWAYCAQTGLKHYLL